MSGQLTRLIKFCLILFAALLCLYLIFILSLTQGAALSNQAPANSGIVSIEKNQVNANRPALLSALFMHHHIVSESGRYYVVVNEFDTTYDVVPLRDMFSRMLLFSNIPLILIIILAICLPILFSRINQRRVDHSMTALNQQAQRLLNAFNIELPQIEHQSNIAKLSHALNAINEQVSIYKRETETNIFQDKLTGLADRHAYLAYLEQQLTIAEQENKKQALLFIDLDGFKQVNDSFGHSFGDEVLIQVAQRLSTVVRNHELSNINTTNHIEQSLSRLGGDEFSIFIGNLNQASRAVEVAKNVLQEIERDFVLGNKVIKIGASIGIAIYPDSASSPYALLQMADVAMYRAKTDGRGIFRVYSPEMGNKMRRYHYLLEEMRLALGSNSFSLSFQPIVHVDDCSIDYFESLVRWHHPIEGIITPAEFIPIAEESNLILELGDWILFEACRQMSAWYNAGMNKVKMSVNISGVQLKHRQLHDWVMETLSKTGLPPHALMLEITESCFIEASEEIIQQIESLRAEGVIIAIDDFGTGFSSLCTLAELPVDVIKIDKLFIDQANENQKYNKILTSISELGRQLGLKVVAEGVEYAEQFELVKRLGIQCVQGYLVSRPETSRNVGTKVLKENLNHIAATGTNVWLPKVDESTPNNTVPLRSIK